MAMQLFARPSRLSERLSERLSVRLWVAGPVATLLSAPLRRLAVVVAANDGLRHAGLISLGLASFIVVLKLSGV